jgi:hypothetical protein
MVACQVFLFNRRPHVDDLTTELLDRIRRQRLLDGTSLHTLHALLRALAARGFCETPGPSS